MKTIEIFEKKAQCGNCKSEKLKDIKHYFDESHTVIVYKCQECKEIVYFYIDISDKTNVIKIKTLTIPDDEE